VDHRTKTLTLRDESASASAPTQRSRATTAERTVARGRWRRRLVRILLCLLVVAGTTMALAELLTPAVGDAAARVTAVDASHHSYPVNVASTDKIAIATVAAEDERFYSHHGIDTLGLLRAAWGGLTGVDRGGSTLDQQLAKNLYTNGQTGFLSRISGGRRIPGIRIAGRADRSDACPPQGSEPWPSISAVDAIADSRHTHPPRTQDPDGQARLGRLDRGHPARGAHPASR
jgi:hypothetical protein